MNLYRWCFVGYLSILLGILGLVGCVGLYHELVPLQVAYMNCREVGTAIEIVTTWDPIDGCTAVINGTNMPIREDGTYGADD